MAKNANIRFEDANVAYVNVDTDTHEMTGGVMDETTGTFYPVGGGGGGPTLNVLIPEQIPGENGVLTDVDPDINDLSYFIREVENAGWPVVMTADEEGVWVDSQGGDTVLTLISSDGDFAIFYYDSINERPIYITDKVIAYKPYFDEGGSE